MCPLVEPHILPHEISIFIYMLIDWHQSILFQSLMKPVIQGCNILKKNPRIKNNPYSLKDDF